MSILSRAVVTDVADAFTVISHRGEHFVMENRPCYGLAFCTEGKTTYRHNGREIVSTSETAILLPMHASYQLYHHEDGRFPLVQFLCATPLTEEFHSFPVRSVEHYLSDFRELQRQAAAGDRLSAVGLLYRILARLEKEGQGGRRILLPIVEYMQKHFAEKELSNLALAKIGGMSEVYMRQLFRLCYGTTPRQYLIGLRVEAARLSLSESDDSIEAIALSSGFASIYHFSRAFRQRTGMTPTEYRSRYVSLSI